MANDKPCLHLPLDEIRIAEGGATAPNVGGIAGDARVRGNPAILHDPAMGTCMRFDGEDDAIELTDLSALTFAQGMTVMAWVRFEDIANFNTIFVFNVERNQSSQIVWAANETNSPQLMLGINGKIFGVKNSIGLQQWRHYAFVYEPSDKVSILIDGVVVFSREAAFDIANAPWTIGYLGKSSYDGDKSMFRGSMAHFRVYNQALAPADVRNLMIGDKSAMAYYRETTLLKVDLHTIRDDDHKPVLYVEADNKGEPLEVSLTNPGDKPVTFKSFSAPTAADFHVQLRFRRNVIAPNVLRALQSPTGVVIDGWHYAAGTTADGREDYISFVKRDDQAPTLDKGAAWRIQIPNFSAAAQGGARNTRIQVRYRTEPQDPGSVVRHMEVQSHLGLKTIPLIARFRGSNTLLNNGTTSNELTIEVVCLNDTGTVRLDDASKFELIVDDDLRSVKTAEGDVTATSSLEAVSRSDWIQAQPAKPGIGHETITFEVKQPEDGVAGRDPAPLMEITRDNPLTFDLSNWVTNLSSGAYNILLRYENIPGYWDGAWVLPVQFSPLVLRGDKIGIGTDEPQATLEVRGDTQISGYTRLQSGARISGDLTVDRAATISGNATVQGAATIGGDVTASGGRIRDKTGDVMPVGAIIAYGGSVVPKGWLLCDGSQFDQLTYSELYQALGNVNTVPDLRSRFIVGASEESSQRPLRKDERDEPLTEYKPNDTGGEAKHMLEVNEMPRHSHWDKSFLTSIGSYDSFNEVYEHANWHHKPVGNGSSVADKIPYDGGSNAHNNLPPYYALIYIIKC